MHPPFKGGIAKHRFRHLRDVLDAPDLDGVRRALQDLIVVVAHDLQQWDAHVFLQ